MIQTIEYSSVLVEPEHFHEGMGPSELVIPAVPGEFYSYSSEFTERRPLYALMKCKSNKSRPILVATELGNEVNLVFLFGTPTQVCAIRTAHASGLLGDLSNDELFGETWIAATIITTEDFYELHLRKNVETLIEICQIARLEHSPTIMMEPGTVIAMMTDAGKYGMFLVKRVTPLSIEIDACHILL